MNEPRRMSDGGLLAGALFVAVVIAGVGYLGQGMSPSAMLASSGASTPTDNTNNNWCGTPTDQASSGSVQEQCKPGCEYQVSLAGGGTPQIIVIKSPPQGLTTAQLQAQPPGQVTYELGGGATSVQTCQKTDANGNPAYSSFSSLNGNAGVTYTENGITAIGNSIGGLFGGSSGSAAPTGGSYYEGYQAGQLTAQANTGPNYPYGSYLSSDTGPETSPSAYANPSVAAANSVPNTLDIDNPANGISLGNTVGGLNTNTQGAITVEELPPVSSGSNLDTTLANILTVPPTDAASGVGAATQEGESAVSSALAGSLSSSYYTPNGLTQEEYDAATYPTAAANVPSGLNPTGYGPSTIQTPAIAADSYVTVPPPDVSAPATSITSTPSVTTSSVVMNPDGSVVDSAAAAPVDYSVFRNDTNFEVQYGIPSVSIGSTGTFLNGVKQ